MLGEDIKYRKLKTLEIYRTAEFECKLGWFEILYDLGQKITSYCNHHSLSLPLVIRIKEKFGVLRVQLRIDADKTHSDLMRKWIKMAETDSSVVCEQCGESGILVMDGGRWHTACKNHRSPDSMLAVDFLAKQKEVRERREQNGNV